MVAPRDLGTIPSSIITDSVQDSWDFIRLDIASPVGAKCFTNRPCGTTAKINLDILGHGAFDWFEYDVEIGVVKETKQDGRTANYLKFANLTAFNGFADKQFTKWANNPGLRGTVIRVYKAAFHPTTHVYQGAFLRFYGELDGGTLGDYYTPAIKVRDTLFAKVAPYHLVGPNCCNIYKGIDCSYTGSEPNGEQTCSHDRLSCRRRSNELNYNGFDLMASPGTELIWVVQG